jgi:hypothetical protein
VLVLVEVWPGPVVGVPVVGVASVSLAPVLAPEVSGAPVIVVVVPSLALDSRGPSPQAARQVSRMSENGRA